MEQLNHKILRNAAWLGATAIILGAMGAHALKKVLEPAMLESFEKGVKYQIYTALLLMFLSSIATQQNSKIIRTVSRLALVGSLLFSVSIYLLTTQVISGIDFSPIGFVTPIGGLLMILAWIMLAIKAKEVFNKG